MEHFNQIVRLFLKNAFLLFILPVVAMVSLWFMTKDQPRKYEVKSKFLYDFGGESTNVSGESLSINEIYTEFLNTLEIVKSRKLIEKIKTQIAFESINDSSTVFAYAWSDENKDEINRVLADILNDKRSPYLSNTEAELEIIAFYDYAKLSSEEIMKAISARRVQSSNFLEIEMTYSNPDQVYYMSNVLNELLTRELGNINKRNIGKQKAVIEELVKKAKKELDQKVQELEDLKVQNNIINLDEHTKAIVTYQVDLEQLRGMLRQQIASSNKAKESIRSGIENNQFGSTNRDINTEILEKKDEVYASQDLKLVHLQKEIDYSKLIQQQQDIYKNYLTIKDNLEQISKNSVYDPTMVHTDMTMQFIDFSVKSERLEDELKELDKEILRVKKYASYFAPFESAISTLRDEISTAQKSYLLFLNKLNMTESLEVGASSSKLELVDYPEFPMEPLPSKTKLVILAGGVAVFILLFAFILVNYLIDNRIKDVATFERIMNKDVVAAMPAKAKDSKDSILSEALDLIHTEGLKKISRAVGESKVVAINALTLSDKADALIEGLKAYWSNENVGVLNLSGEKEEIEKEVNSASKKYDRVICLSTPLQFSHDGINAAEIADCSFLHFNLGRIKSVADERIIRTYSEEVTNNQGFILSELLPEYMDSYIGELPKRRNKIRKIIKKLVNRDLSWS
ncbi:GumC family protein [Ekhidna sp.]